LQEQLFPPHKPEGLARATFTFFTGKRLFHHMDTYGLLGYPLGHSFSRKFFTEKFSNEGIDAEYLNFEIPDASQLRDIVNRHPQLRGLNVTIPHKQAVISQLDALSPQAREIGAVNVIKVDRNTDGTPRLTGYNADVIGFSQSIRPLLQPYHRKALILGTGGASKAVCYGLKQLNVEPVWVSRHAPYLTYGEITPELLQEYTVIVNCTPLGMFPHTEECPPLPYESLTSRHLLYDLIYNPEETMFMKRGQQAGAVTKNGLEMLHLQALASWDIWQSEAP